MRLQVVTADAEGAASSTVSIAAIGDVPAGETRTYPWWFRDPSGSPCLGEFNLSNALEVTWAP